MKVSRKEIWMAWVLMLVLMQAVAVTSLHVHKLAPQQVCQQCVHHTVHSSHLSAVNIHHLCPVCQFNKTSYEMCQAATTRAVTSPPSVAEALPAETLPGLWAGSVLLRAPPFVMEESI